LIEPVFLEITFVVVLAVFVTIIMRLLKQPLIIGYILTGLIVSPIGLNIIQSENALPALAEIGVSILLFLVGIHLNPKVIKDMGKVSLIAGLGQIIFTSLVGFGLCYLLGFDLIVSIYVAIALTFSSTIVIMKLLSDKGELESLYGRITLGVLIIQDIVAMLMLIALSSSPGEGELGTYIIFAILKTIGLIVGIYLISKLLFPLITKTIAKSQEILLFFSIGWCLIVGSIFGFLGFSIEAGALLAGVALSVSPLRYEISSKLRPLRDFFILLFFVVLGSQMTFNNIATYTVPIIVLSLFVLIGNPIIVMILMGLLGYTKRNSLFTGLAMAQISEFSLIIIAIGSKFGHVSSDILSVVTLIGIITIAGSSYMMMYNNKLYNLLSPILNIFERRGKKVDEHKYLSHDKHHVLLFGYHRIGFDLAESFKKMKKKFLVIDNNPEIILDLAKQGIDCRYGDASNIELLNELNFKEAKMIASTIPDLETNLLLIKFIKEHNSKALIITVSNQVEEALELYKAGASYVIMPHMLGGKHTSLLIESHGLNEKKFLKERQFHLNHIQKRAQSSYYKKP